MVALNSPLINAAIYSHIVCTAGESVAKRVWKKLDLDCSQQVEDVEIVQSFDAGGSRSTGQQPIARKLSMDEELDRVQEQVLEK